MFRDKIVSHLSLVWRGWAAMWVEYRAPRCRENMAHIRQSRSDHGLGFQASVSMWDFVYNISLVRRGWAAMCVEYKAPGCRKNMAYARQSRSNSGLGFQVKVLHTFQVVPSWLGGGHPTRSFGALALLHNLEYKTRQPRTLRTWWSCWHKMAYNNGFTKSLYNHNGSAKWLYGMTLQR